MPILGLLLAAVFIAIGAKPASAISFDMSTLHVCAPDDKLPACMALRQEDYAYSVLQYLGTEFVIILLTVYILGMLVEDLDWNPNYTRKFLGIVIIVSPLVITTITQSQRLAATERTAAEITLIGPVLSVAICNMAFLLLFLLLLSGPLRRRSKILSTAFAALDRPEDRPFTLLWFGGANIFALVLVAAMAAQMRPAYYMIIIVGVAIGDLLAGAIGYRYGKLRYGVRALGTERMYSRSLEGSACIILVAVAAIVYLSSGLPLNQFWPCLLILPTALALAEALSPRTFDEPFMLLAGAAGVMLIERVWQSPIT